MKFFLPKTENPEQAESAWELGRKIVSASMGWPITNRRIFAIDYVHNGKPGRDEVGELNRDTGETVLAIYESNAFLVCTRSRGFAGGIPLLMGRGDTESVVDFEPAETEVAVKVETGQEFHDSDGNAHVITGRMVNKDGPHYSWKCQHEGKCRLAPKWLPEAAFRGPDDPDPPTIKIVVRI